MNWKIIGIFIVAVVFVVGIAIRYDIVNRISYGNITASISPIDTRFCGSETYNFSFRLVDPDGEDVTDLIPDPVTSTNWTTSSAALNIVETGLAADITADADPAAEQAVVTVIVGFGGTPPDIEGSVNTFVFEREVKEVKYV